MSSGWTRRCIGLSLLAAGIGAATIAHAQTVDPAEKKLAGAQGLLARNQYDLAAHEFDEFLAQYPADPRTAQANFGRALCAYNLNDAPTAAAFLEKAVADKNFPRREEALALLGTVDLAQNQPDRALAALDSLAKEFPKSAQLENAGVNRAQALYRLGRYEDSLAAVREVLNTFPKTPLRASVLYVAALDQRGLNDDAAAATILADVTTNYPNSPFVYDAQLLIGETLVSQGKFEDAIAHYKKLQADVPESRKAAAAFGLGMALSQAGRYADAQRTFDALAAAYPASPFAGNARLQIAVGQVKAGARDHARDLLAAVAREYPALTNSAAYWTARCDLLDEKYAAAKTALERLAAAKTAELPDVAFDLAYCDLMLGQDAAAIKGLEAFRAAYPHSTHLPEVFYDEATALHRQGDFEKSIQYCDAAAGNPKNPIAGPALLLKGENTLMLGHYENADAIFASLSVYPLTEAQRLRAQLRRGQCSYFAGDYKTAEARLKDVAANPASAADPVLQEAAFLLGDAQLQQGENQTAAATLKTYLATGKGRREEAAFKLALAQVGEKDSNAAVETLRGLMQGDLKSEWIQRSWLEYAQLAYDQKNSTEAKTAAEKVLAAKPAEAIAAPAGYLMARIEMDAAQYPAAAARLDALMKAYPKNPLADDAMYVRGICLREAGQPAEAQKQFTAYQQNYPAGRHLADARHQSALCLAALGKTGDAVKTLTDLAARADTRNEAVLYDLAWAYRGGNDTKNAIDTYQTLLHDYPKTVKAAAARVELPELLFADQKYQPAADLLNAAIADSATEPRLKSLALYRLGYCYARLNDPAKAATTFDAFAKNSPKDPLVPDAISEAGAAYAQMDKLDEAKARQSQVIADFPASPAAKIARLRLGEAQNQAAEYPAAAQTFTDWLKQYPADPLAPRANFGLGWSLENRSQFPEARQAYEKVTAADNGPTAARAQFQIGETYFAQKQYDAAARELLKVDIQYAAPQWAARALYEAGRSFEQLKQPDRAKQQYQDCLKKYKDSDIAPLARQRLEALGG